MATKRPRAKTGEPSARRLPDSFEFLADVAEKFFSERRTQGEIARDLEERYGVAIDASTVNRLVTKARDLGIVSFSYDPLYGLTAERDGTTSKEMVEVFGLDDCDVAVFDPGFTVKVEEGLAHHSPTVASTEDAASIDTGTQVRLANFAGKHSRFRNRECIAVGGGRTVLRFAKYVSDRCRRPYDVTVIPLSGRIWSGSWKRGDPIRKSTEGTKETATREHAAVTETERLILEQPLDADDASVLLASAFEGPHTEYLQIGHPLFAESEDAARSIMDFHAPMQRGNGWNFGVRQPDWAILGVGAFDPRTAHRLFKFIHETNERELFDRKTGEPLPSAPYVARVYKDLTGALAVVRDHRLSTFGDLGNRFFPTLPFPSSEFTARAPSVNLAAYRELGERLTRVNGKAVLMEWRHLRDVRNVHVIGGGAGKLATLWTALLARLVDPSPGPLISQLTIDAPTAKRLLEFAKRMAREPAWQRWYAEAFRELRLFRD